MQKRSILLGSLMGLAVTVTAVSAAMAPKPFTDVPTDHWAYKAIEAGRLTGLWEGYPNGTFGLNNNITRAEVAVAMYRHGEMMMKDMEAKMATMTTKLEAMEKKMAEMDGIDVEDKLTTAKIDLNGDGKEEVINITFEEDIYDPYPNVFTLKINDLEIKGEEANFQGYFRIVDIDKEGKYKEIIIGSIGPSNDYTTKFYTYDGSKIINMGVTSGVYIYDYTGGKMMDSPGDGTFTTQTRGQVLHTWAYEDEYGLNADHTIKHLPQELYEMDTEVTMLKDLPLQTSQTDSKIITTLKTGDKAILVSTDDKQWVLAKDKNGIEGWFELEGEYGLKIKALGLDAIEVFEGLTMAD